LGELTYVKGEIPDPAGVIRVQFTRKGGQGIRGSIELPAGVTGAFLKRKNVLIGFRHATH